MAKDWHKNNMTDQLPLADIVLAEKLKKLNYDYRTIRFWQLEETEGGVFRKGEHGIGNLVNWGTAPHRASRPEITQISKWLREKKNIHVIPGLQKDGKYSVTVDGNGTGVSLFDYSSWEEAELVGVNWAVDNLLKNL